MGKNTLNENAGSESLTVDQAIAVAESLVDSVSEDDESPETKQWVSPLANNKYFRCLGYYEGELVFANKRTAFIQYVKVDKIGSKICLSLAPYSFWHGLAPKKDEKGNVSDSVMWDQILDMMFRATEDAGLWNNRNQHEQGARFDRGRVVFHTGEKVWIEGTGLMSPGDVQGENCYTARIGARLPDFDTPFEAGAPEVRELLRIIKALAWRQDSRALSEMTLFGYLQMAPVCGILKWRPHVWLDGARGDGKTWVVQNIVNRVLGPHCEMVKSNSTESGLRNLLHARSIPTVFDEAEGSSARDKARMEEIISLARHTSSETDAVVAQGVSGGGASRRYSISSMFFLASIATRIDKPSDQTRFARISLGPGLRGQTFIEQVEVPALRLLTDSFTDRFIGRAVIRAGQAENIIRVMTGALMLSGMERRVADVYGVFAAGAWMALRDGVPQDEQDALAFISEEFGALDQIRTVNSDLARDRDHDRVVRHIMAATRRIETSNGPVVSEKVGVLMRIIAGQQDDGSLVTTTDALRELNNMGIRPAHNGEACDPGPHVTHFLLHRKSEIIRSILEKTPYEAGFSEILLQTPGVVLDTKTTRFRGASPERGLLVPASIFVGDGEEVSDDEPTPPKGGGNPPSKPVSTYVPPAAQPFNDNPSPTGGELSGSLEKNFQSPSEGWDRGDPFDEDMVFGDYPNAKEAQVEDGKSDEERKGSASSEKAAPRSAAGQNKARKS